MVPQGIILSLGLFAYTHSSFSDFSEEQDVVLAVVDHLLCDLLEKISHTVVGVIVPGNSMNHLNAVH